MSKIISFTVPLTLTSFYVIIDDGRIFQINYNDKLMSSGQTIIAEVIKNTLIISKEFSNDNNQNVQQDASNPGTYSYIRSFFYL